MIHDLFHFFGRAICHQLEERSLQASGETLSVCARDTGIYIGIFSTLIYLHLFKRGAKITIPTIKISLFLLLLMVPLMIDGLGSYLHLFETDNTRRLLTGISFGLALPNFLYPLLSPKALDETSKPVITVKRDFFIPLILSCGLGGLVYWGKISYFVLDGFLILTVMIWFSMCGSFLFSSIQNTHLKSALSVCSGLVLLSTLSLLHSFVA
ncbi:DUF2085 domain-containing protein [Bacillus sp. S3]|uniref:DUF2085 domain-containing protein n=1 Tax=Bacillus sp. S3 TaxID=486398 RepID=UPI0011884E3B|nr:DUF2085 domain-containing protein [Bacillus sp. S3]QCJ44020.1 DUF2085 domain-containing protein [Bacillus sp. S3]